MEVQISTALSNASPVTDSFVNWDKLLKEFRMGKCVAPTLNVSDCNVLVKNVKRFSACKFIKDKNKKPLRPGGLSIVTRTFWVQVWGHKAQFFGISI